MIPPSGYLRRVIFTFALVTVPLMIGLLFTYDVIKIYWNPGHGVPDLDRIPGSAAQMGAERSDPGRRPGHPAGHHRRP